MAEDRKFVVITGAAGGMGRAAAERLARGGWDVLAVDYNADLLNGWAAAADHVTPHVADVSAEADNIAMVARAEALSGGGIDAILLNAAVTGGGGIETLPFADFERVIAVNLYGVVHGIRAALPALRKRRGSIVVTSSTMGLGGEADNWAYCTAKHGLHGLVKAVAREVGWEGIRVNAVCPGATRATGMTAFLDDVPVALDRLARASALQRWAEADEMAAAMEFLISPAASFITGVALPVDGGAIAGTGLVPPASGPATVHPAAREETRHG